MTMPGYALHENAVIFLFFTAKQLSCPTIAKTICKSIPNGTPLRHPGSQSLSEEPSTTNITGTVYPQRTIQNLVAPVHI